LPADDQLYKDIEGALEYCQDGLLTVVAVVAQKGAPGGNSKNGALRDPALLQASFTLCSFCRVARMCNWG
jgi:hypothetical protein